MRFLWMAILCTACVLASCDILTPPAEFGTPPPEQNMFDFIKVGSYRNAESSVRATNIAIDLLDNSRSLLRLSSLEGTNYSNTGSAILNFNTTFTSQSLLGITYDANAITTDKNGNYYVTGSKNGDIVVSKYSLVGTLLWEKTNGGPGYDKGLAIAVDASGNIAVAGCFTGESKTSTTQDAYLAKYNSDGQILWSKTLWSADEDNAQSVSFDAKGNIIVAGSFRGSTLTIDSVKLRRKGYDIFIASYTPTGTLRWAKQGIGTMQNSSRFGVEQVLLSVAKTGEIYIGGTFTQQLTLDSITLRGSTSTFLARYDEDGRIIWARNPKSNDKGHSTCRAISASPNGVAVAGTFSGETEFDGFTQRVQIDYQSSSYIAQYGRDGQVRWLKRIDNPQKMEDDISVSQSIDAIAAADDGTTYLAGSHNTDIVIGGQHLSAGRIISGYTQPGPRTSGGAYRFRASVMFLAKIGRK